MESQPQHPEFRNNPENFHPSIFITYHLLKPYSTQDLETRIVHFVFSFSFPEILLPHDCYKTVDNRII